MGGKVLVSMQEHCDRLVAARLQADIMGTEVSGWLERAPKKRYSSDRIFHHKFSRSRHLLKRSEGCVHPEDPMLCVFPRLANLGGLEHGKPAAIAATASFENGEEEIW